MVQAFRVACLNRLWASLPKHPLVSTPLPHHHVTARSVVSRTLFVGGISNRVREEYLRSVFASHGKVTEARLCIDPISKISRGFGFIQYASVQEAEAAMKLMNGQALCGRRIRVTYAVSEPKDAV